MKKLFVFALAALSAAVVAAPALADAPIRLPTLTLNNVVTGETSCGTLRWDIHLVAGANELRG